ncbi:MAG TPA: ATP synthase F0 subunit B [Candidatus Angelobacter sp.]|nr:ATP synthase F0 subunit B [Candidatus Angelobacter sp.]
MEKVVVQEEAKQGADQKPNGKKEENAEEAFRHSSSVKLIAKITGLDVDKAYWLSVILNFLILFFIVWVPAKKFLPNFFKSRTEAIQKRLEESRKSTEEARRRLAEVEGRLSRLDADIAQMRAEADSSAHAEEQRVLAAVQEEHRRIVQSAEQEIAMAANAARRELKAFAADLAVDLAEKKIQSRKIADEALVHDFAAQLGKDGR